MKSIVFTAILVLCASICFGAQTCGVGFTSNSKLEKIGATVVTGTQQCLDKDRQMFVREEFQKVNWGNLPNLDKVSLKYISYWDLPIWNLNNSFKFGIHAAGDYRVENGDLGATFGAELYKKFEVVNYPVGIYGILDYVNVKDFEDYFLIGVGFVLGE